MQESSTKFLPKIEKALGLKLGHLFEEYTPQGVRSELPVVVLKGTSYLLIIANIDHNWKPSPDPYIWWAKMTKGRRELSSFEEVLRSVPPELQRELIFYIHALS